MHVAFFSPAWPLKRFHNGIVTYVHWMKSELEREGHRVSVFAGDLQGPSTDDRVHPISPSMFSRVRSRIRRISAEQRVFDAYIEIARAIRGVHRREPIDVIEMEESFGWFAQVAELTSLPTVVKLHGPAFLSMEALRTAFGRERIAREGMALRKVAAITSPCHYTLHQTIERYDLKPGLCRKIVNPMTLPDTAPLWNLDSCNREAILFVGRFDFCKGGDVVLNAFRQVLERKKQCRLVFVGPDMGIDDSAGTRINFNAYRDSVFPVELRGQVDYRGPLPNDEVAKLRAEALVTVIASRRENLGYTLLEAMLQGCPVVSSDAGGCPEALDGGTVGLLAKSGNFQDFAVKLLSVLDDPVGAARLGKAARLRALETYSAPKIAAESLKFYMEVIARHDSFREHQPASGITVER
jgi:glycosyltransferase involved in cell wall biosynthesis